jgi:hypothetical protein
VAAATDPVVVGPTPGPPSVEPSESIRRLFDSRRLRLGRGRALRDGLIVGGLFFLGYVFVVLAPQVQTFGFDARAYWGFPRPDPYVSGEAVNGVGVYRYSPVFLPLLAALSQLPWWQFLWLWTALLAGTAWWLGGRWPFLVFAFPPVALELYHGNIHLLLAAAIVLGFRYPAAWAFVLLTKVTPGIGLLWFAVRREWRALATALAVTGALVAVSVVAAPGLWRDWIDSLVSSSASQGPNHVAIPLLMRLPVAALVVAWGALTDRRWTVPVAATLALPTIWFHGLALLVAVVPLAWPRRPRSAAAAATPG